MREACDFLSSSAFAVFAEVIPSIVKGNLASSFLRETQREDFILTWVSGNRGSGYGMTVAESDNIRQVGGDIAYRPHTAFPELKLTDGGGKPMKAVPQLTISTGHMSLDGYTLPADVVVDKSSRILSAKYQLVKMKWGSLDVDDRATIAIKAHQDGGFSVFDKGKYSKDASERLFKALAGNSLFHDLGIVS